MIDKGISDLLEDLYEWGKYTEYSSTKKAIDYIFNSEDMSKQYPPCCHGCDTHTTFINVRSSVYMIGPVDYEADIPEFIVTYMGEQE